MPYRKYQDNRTCHYYYIFSGAFYHHCLWYGSLSWSKYQYLGMIFFNLLPTFLISLIFLLSLLNLTWCINVLWIFWCFLSPWTLSVNDTSQFWRMFKKSTVLPIFPLTKFSFFTSFQLLLTNLVWGPWSKEYIQSEVFHRSSRLVFVLSSIAWATPAPNSVYGEHI